MLLHQENTLHILNNALNQTPKIRKGTDAVYYCPICKHHKKKLEVNLITGKYHCWVCGFGGNSIKTLLKKLNIKNTLIGDFKEPKQLSKFDKLFDLEDESDVSKEILSLPKDYISFQDTDNSIEKKHALYYLKKRNVTDVDIERYNLGYCLKGEYKNRIIVPSYDAFGNLNYFTARAIYESIYKYISCDFTKNIIGFELLTNFDEPITLVEGAFDAITVKNNCVPLFGKTLSNSLKLKLLETRPPIVNVVLDNDALQDSIKICEFLLQNEIKTKMILLKDKDPNTIGHENTWNLINSTKILTQENLFEIKLWANI